MRICRCETEMMKGINSKERVKEEREREWNKERK